MERTYIANALVLGLSAGLSPGPLMALVVTETLKTGVGGGIRVSLAPLCTDAPIIGLSLLLLARMSEHLWVLGCVALLGALVMGWMGLESLTFGGAPAPDREPRAGSLARGIAANALNPAPYLFWATIGAPLLLEAWSDGLPWAALFVTCFYLCLVGAKVFTAMAVGKSRRFLSSRYYIGAVRVLGAVLIGFSAQFLWKAAGYLGWP